MLAQGNDKVSGSCVTCCHYEVIAELLSLNMSKPFWLCHHSNHRLRPSPSLKVQKL